MKIVLNTKAKLLITMAVTILVLGITTWEHFNGGVATHHFLSDKDMPGISNWWGLFTIPVSTWVILSILQKRKEKNQNEKTVSRLEINRFIGSFMVGIILTLLFYNTTNLHNYLLLLTFAVALFIPLYKPEYYLGFILSMTYGFGGVLPVVFGVVLIAIYAFEYCILRKYTVLLFHKIMPKKQIKA